MRLYFLGISLFSLIPVFQNTFWYNRILSGLPEYFLVYQDTFWSTRTLPNFQISVLIRLSQAWHHTFSPFFSMESWTTNFPFPNNFFYLRIRIFHYLCISMFSHNYSVLYMYHRLCTYVYFQRGKRDIAKIWEKDQLLTFQKR